MEPSEKNQKKENIADVLAALQQSPSLVQWRNAAFTAAVDKFMKTKGDAETVMQTGEAFGRGVFTEYLKNQSKDWTLTKWLASTDHVLTPLGTPLECMEMTRENAKSITTKMTSSDPEEQEMASLFTYGYLRGMFLSAFPEGELLLENPTNAPVTAFTFKPHASVKDRFERERVKLLFTSLKKV